MVLTLLKRYLQIRPWRREGVRVRHTGRAVPTRSGYTCVRRAQMIAITRDITIDERDLHERFVRASGPGGQNVNKVATAVELRFNIESASLPADMKARLYALAANRISEGILLIDSRAHRTQLENREAARERLVELLGRAAVVPKKRRPTKPKAAARERRLETKKRRSGVKSLRGRKGID